MFFQALYTKCLESKVIAVASPIFTLPEHQLCPLIESSQRPGGRSMSWGEGYNLGGRGHDLGVGIIVMSVLHIKK